MSDQIFASYSFRSRQKTKLVTSVKQDENSVLSFVVLTRFLIFHQFFSVHFFYTELAFAFASI